MGDHFIFKNNSLDFPTWDDPPHLVRPLFELVSDVEEFCQGLGFPVVPGFEEGDRCYNGIPVADKLHLGKLGKTDWYEMFTGPANKKAVHMNYTEIFNWVFREPRIFKNFYRLIAGVAIFAVVCHFFNRHQMRLRDEQEEQERKRAKERALRRKAREEKRRELEEELTRMRRKRKND